MSAELLSEERLAYVFPLWRPETDRGCRQNSTDKGSIFTLVSSHNGPEQTHVILIFNSLHKQNDFNVVFTTDSSLKLLFHDLCPSIDSASSSYSTVRLMWPLAFNIGFKCQTTLFHISLLFHRRRLCNFCRRIKSVQTSGLIHFCNLSWLRSDGVQLPEMSAAVGHSFGKLGRKYIPGWLSITEAITEVFSRQHVKGYFWNRTFNDQSVLGGLWSDG